LGDRGKAGSMQEEATFKPVTGHAVIHAGRKLHEVLPVTSGERFALIMWSRSLSNVRAGACPCCWMNNRNSIECKCIVSPAWN